MFSIYFYKKKTVSHLSGAVCAPACSRSRASSRSPWYPRQATLFPDLHERKTSLSQVYTSIGIPGASGGPSGVLSGAFRGRPPHVRPKLLLSAN